MHRPPLYFREAGPQDAPALVLLHSLATHGELWAPQVPAWSTRYRVICIDLPGHGKSPVLPGVTTLDGMATEVVAVLDYLGIRRAAVVGLSLGGMVGQAFALAYPHRLDALVLAHAGARTEAPVREIWEQRIAQFSASGMEQLPQATLERWFPRAFAEAAPLTMAWMAGLIRATSAVGYVMAIHAIQRLDYLDRLGAITAPTLVLAGQADAAVPAAVAARLAECIPNARLQLLDDVGHIGNVQVPIAFTERVGDFLASAIQPAGTGRPEFAEKLA